LHPITFTHSAFVKEEKVKEGKVKEGKSKEGSWQMERKIRLLPPGTYAAALTAP
jgi:hypothetical protein